jgi:hypothetical protein
MLMSMLCQCKEYIKVLEVQNIKYQTATILNATFAAGVKTKLAHKEDKRKKKDNQEFDLPRVLQVITELSFVQLHLKHLEKQQEAEAAKQDQSYAKACWMEAVKAWEESNKKCKKDAKDTCNYNKKT